MVNLIEAAQGISSHFEARIGPDFHDFDERRAALAAFEAVGFPTHRDEEFRFTPLRDLAEMRLSPAAQAPFAAEDLARLPIASFPGPRLVFVNGFFRADLSNPSSGVEAVDGKHSHPSALIGSIGHYRGKLGSTNDPRFARLNDALWTQAAVVRISQELAEPIQLLYISTEGSPFAVHPRVWIEAEAGSRAHIVETHVGVAGAYFSNPVTEILVRQGATATHTRVQHESPGAYHIGHVWAHQEAGSTFTSNSVQFGARVGRLDVNVWLDGEGTETWLNGAYVGRGTQVLDNKTRLDHAQPNCHSFEVYKGILDDESAGVFNGKIFVYEDAQKTDAKQTNQALLLSPRASFDTKPQLEIFADDVKCTHGATVGQMRGDQLFYLRSRGVSLAEARNLLVYAFVAEVLEKIEIEPLRSYLEAELYAKLSRRPA